MTRKRYIFNNRTLSYEEQRISSRQKIWLVLRYLLGSVTFAVILMFLFINFFGSPKEKMLEREIAQYELQLEILNDRFAQVEAVLADLRSRDEDIYRVIFEAEPIPDEIRKAGFGGADRYDGLEGYSNSDRIIQTSRRLDIIASQLYVQSKSFDEVFELAKNKSQMLASIPAIQPIKNDELKRISSTYGYRMDPFYKVQKFHHGIDFSAPVGTEIFATGDGTVELVKYSRRGYGNQILIDHGFGYQTFYAHLDQIEVRKGAKVKRGQIIGTVGNSGKSTAPHLHYEVRRNNRTINPIYYFFNDLNPEEYELMLEIASQPTQSMD